MGTENAQRLILKRGVVSVNVYFPNMWSNASALGLRWNHGRHPLEACVRAASANSRDGSFMAHLALLYPLLDFEAENMFDR